MRWATRAALAPALLVVACLAAGTFGAVVSVVIHVLDPAHFVGPTLEAFGVPADVHDRRGAAIIGRREGSSVGLIHAPPIIVAALFSAGPLAAVSVLLRGLGDAGIAAVAFAPGSLVLGWMVLRDVDRFAVAGVLHEAIFLGGYVGTLIGVAVTFRAVLRADRATRLVDTPRAPG